MRPVISKVVILATVLILISACAPRDIVTPDGTTTPEVADPGITAIPADVTTLPTAIENPPTIPAPGREDFVAADLTAEPWAGLQQRLADSFAAGEAWASDPDQIALEFSLDPTAMILAETIQKDDTHAVMLITEVIAEDDSVAEQQVLLELSRPGTDAAWAVDFIGLRWKCREGRGQQDWAPELCV